MSKKKVVKSEFPPGASKRTIIALIVGAAAATVGLVTASYFGLIHIPGLSPSPDVADKYQATIVIGPAGFSPAALRVRPYTRVYFENQDSVNHRVDVSLNPPDKTFGSPNEILPTTGYTFSFIRSGTYMFHDGNNPTANGEVIVQ